MEHAQNLVSPQRVKYADLRFRLAMSLFAAHHVITADIYQPLSKILTLPFYYIALVASTVIAFVLMSYVRYVSIRLDRKYPWESLPLPRLLIQAFYGIFIAVFIGFILGSIYFWVAKGIPFWKNGWESRYAPRVSLLLTILNAYYFGYYAFVRFGLLKSEVRQANQEPSTQLVIETVIAEPEAPSISLPVESSLEFNVPLLVLYENGVKKIFTKNGVDVSTRSLEEIYNQLPQKDYIHVAKIMIVKRSNIKAVNKLKEGGASVEVYVPEGKVLNVSQRQKVKFEGYFSLLI